MRKYLIMLAVFVIWCITLPAVVNLVTSGISPLDEISEDEKTQDITSDVSNIDNSEQELEDIYDENPIENSDISNKVEEDKNTGTPESETETSTPTEESDGGKTIDTKPKLPTQSANASLFYVNVYNHKTKKIMRLELEEYVIGVVYAEVPSSFDEEALKAQAIAARSYAVHNYKEKQRMRGHSGAEICTNPAHCLAFYTKADIAARYGDEFAEKSYNIIREATLATKGIVMTYDGEPANTVFHASSSGFTEDCAEIWGGNYPYLISVTTPDESDFYGFYGRTSFTAAEIRSKLSLPQDSLKGDPSTWFSDYIKNSSGRCVQVTIGGKTFTGEEVRKNLRLKSTMFKITPSENSLTFDTEGYGHGVGMSQYGADIMASKGSNARQILEHYYTGVKFEQVNKEWFK